MANEAAKNPAGKDDFIERFEIESDLRLAKFVGFFAVVGAGLVTFALTTQALVPSTLTQAAMEDTTRVTLKMDDKKAAKDKEKEKEISKKPIPPHPRSGEGGKAHGKGIPNARITKATLTLITSTSQSNSLTAYDLLQKKFAKDLDHVMSGVSGLSKSGNTQIGARRGKADGTGMEGYSVGGSGGVDDLLGGLWGQEGGPIGNKGLKGGSGLRAPTAADIDMGEENAQRSTESILRVIRQHTPGLRHIYTKYLKTNPDFSGKITFRFIIAPSGSIVDLNVIASTTGITAFDQEVSDAVKSWRFEPIKGKATDKVTVPFTFSI